VPGTGVSEGIGPVRKQQADHARLRLRKPVQQMLLRHSTGSSCRSAPGHKDRMLPVRSYRAAFWPCVSSVQARGHPRLLFELQGPALRIVGVPILESSNSAMAKCILPGMTPRRIVAGFKLAERITSSAVGVGLTALSRRTPLPARCEGDDIAGLEDRIVPDLHARRTGAFFAAFCPGEHVLGLGSCVVMFCLSPPLPGIPLPAALLSLIWPVAVVGRSRRTGAAASSAQSPFSASVGGPELAILGVRRPAGTCTPRRSPCCMLLMRLIRRAVRCGFRHPSAARFASNFRLLGDALGASFS